ncbi:MAG: FAD-dependent oxidoreductase, partial [Ginsengibacter sp.]
MFDITKPIDLTIHAEGTGPKRSQRPEYVDFMPPCNSACPAGENIQAWMDHAQSGNYFEAFQTLVEDNPFPAIMGRVCVKPCETGCNRTHIDTTVNIHAVERYIGDEAIKEKWPIQFVSYATGKRILIVGGGPSGLSAAYHLLRMGHSVEIYESGPHAGGLLWTGVPDYRLPKNILEAEINRIERLGVKIKLNYQVTDVLLEKKMGNFDAVYLAIGAQQIRNEEFQHDNSVYITDAF